MAKLFILLLAIVLIERSSSAGISNNDTTPIPTTESPVSNETSSSSTTTTLQPPTTTTSSPPANTTASNSSAYENIRTTILTFLPTAGDYIRAYEDILVNLPDSQQVNVMLSAVNDAVNTVANQTVPASQIVDLSVQLYQRIRDRFLNVLQRTAVQIVEDARNSNEYHVIVRNLDDIRGNLSLAGQRLNVASDVVLRQLR